MRADLVAIWEALKGEKTEEALRANRFVQSSDALLAAFEGFAKSITTKGQDQTASLLTQAALRDAVHEKHPTHLLHLSVVSSGGQTIRKRSLVGSGIDYSGGVVVSYFLADITGKIISGGTEAKQSVNAKWWKGEWLG